MINELLFCTKLNALCQEAILGRSWSPVYHRLWGIVRKARVHCSTLTVWRRFVTGRLRTAKCCWRALEPTPRRCRLASVSWSRSWPRCAVASAPWVLGLWGTSLVVTDAASHVRVDVIILVVHVVLPLPFSYLSALSTASNDKFLRPL